MNVLALPDDPIALKGVITENLQVIAELEERVRLFQAMLFGSKSEKRKEPDPTAHQQHSLFDEAEATIEISPEVEGIVQIPAHARKKCVSVKRGASCGACVRQEERAVTG